MKRVVLLAAAVVCTAGSLSAQQYGGAVAISGDHVFIGEAQNGTLPGIVYVYRGSTGSWEESGRISAAPEGSPPDGFGKALAADDGMVLVGAPLYDEGRGTAFLYRVAASGSWEEVARLSPDGPDGSGFGASVALQGGIAVVSAPEEGGTGRVYTFRRGADGGWTQQARIAPEGATLAAFGTRVAFDGSTLLVATADRPETPGSVRAYALQDGAVVGPAQELAVEGLGERSGYGASLGVRGEVALVGAPGASQRSGVVVSFRLEAGTWSPAGMLAAFDGPPRAQFGASIAYDRDEAWIGAPGAASGRGSIYRMAFTADRGWTRATKLTDPSLPDGAGFSNAASVVGDLAVVGAGGIDGRAGGAVIMERDGRGTFTGGELLIGEHRGFPAIVGEEVECSENDAAGFECDNVNVVSFLPIKDLGGARGTMVNDIWGWTDPQTGHEIAIVGRSDGTSFVDITDPYNPRLLGDLPKTEGSRSSVWRDMKVFRDHVYIVADAANEHGVQVFDLRQLRDVGAEPQDLEPTFTYRGINSAHNIVINEETGFAYAVGSSGGGETCGGGLHMIDINDPGRPVFAGCFFDVSTGRSRTGYSHDAQCVIYHGPDTEHQGKEICLGSNETALSIADVTDKERPVAISAISYPNVAYTHQGWLTDDHRYFYQNDEGDEPQGLVEGTRTLVWDLADLDDPILVKEYFATTPDTDHNLYVVGNLMYQSNYGAGLRILDVTNPTDPVEIAYFDTTPYGGGGAWSNYPYFESGVIVATSMGDGLFVLKNTGRRNLIP